MQTLDEQIFAPFALKDAFEEFKRKCRDLRDRYGKFSYEYGTVEPQLLKIHELMKKGRELKDYFKMDELYAALRDFNEKALAFSAAGFTDEENFYFRIEKVIEIIHQMRSDFDTISSKIDSYEDEDEEGEKGGSGIGEQLTNIANRMKEMGESMQAFDVIGTDFFQKKMANQTKQAQRVIAVGRGEKKRHAGEKHDEMRSDLEYQRRISALNVEFKQLTEEHRSRKLFNQKIEEVKNFLWDLGDKFLKAYVVLNADPEIYKKLRPKRKQATKGYLGRFQEILSAINSKLIEIEQYLTFFEWEDVEMSHINSQIKIQISSLYKIIAELTPMLELDNVDIDPVKTEAFVKAKTALFEQINNVNLISEKRWRIAEIIKERQDIQQIQEETMPNI